MVEQWGAVGLHYRQFTTQMLNYSVFARLITSMSSC